MHPISRVTRVQCHTLRHQKFAFFVVQNCCTQPHVKRIHSTLILIAKGRLDIGPYDVGLCIQQLHLCMACMVVIPAQIIQYSKRQWHWSLWCLSLYTVAAPLHGMHGCKTLSLFSSWVWTVCTNKSPLVQSIFVQHKVQFLYFNYLQKLLG